MADINTYALGLELQLQTTKAFEALDQLKIKLDSIAVAMSTAPEVMAPREFQQGAEAAGLNEFAVYKLNDAYTETNRIANELADAYGELAEGSGFFGDTTEEQIKKFDKVYDKLIDQQRAMDKLGLEGKKLTAKQTDQAKSMDLLFKSASKLRLAFVDSKKASTAKTEALKGLSGLFSKAGGSAEFLSGQLIHLAKGAITPVGIAIAILIKGFMDVIEMQEKFRFATFRNIGTMERLITISNDLRVSMGVTAEVATKTLTALSGAGFKASDNIKALAKANIMFSETTGVSAEAAALYQRKIIAIGGSVEEASQHLADMTNAMQNAGLTASEVESIMGSLSDTVFTMSAVMEKDSAIQMAKGMTSLAAAVKSVGGNATAAVNALKPLMESPLQFTIAMGKLGKPFSVEQLGNPEVYMKGVMELNEQLAAEGRSAIEREAIFKARGVNLEVAATAQKLYNDNIRVGSKEYESFIKKQKDGAALQENWNKSLQTVLQQLQRMFEPIMAFAATLMESIAPLVTTILQPIGATLRMIGSMLKPIGALLNLIIKPFTIVQSVLGKINTAFFEGLMESLQPLIDAFDEMATAMSELFDTGEGSTMLIDTFKTLGKVVGMILMPVQFLAKFIRVLADGFRWWKTTINDLWKSLKESKLVQWMQDFVDAAKWLYEQFGGDKPKTTTAAKPPLAQTPTYMAPKITPLSEAEVVATATQIARQAEPVKTVTTSKLELSDDKRSETKELIRGSKDIYSVVSDVNKKLEENPTAELLKLLKMYLPKIADPDKGPSLNSSMSQW